jgi:hypothetical protein
MKPSRQNTRQAQMVPGMPFPDENFVQSGYFGMPKRSQLRTNP